MGNFRSDNRGGFGGRSSGSRFGGRDRFGDRNSRRSPEMYDVTCDKCGKQCQVPFRPTGDKPVLCSDCFRKNDGSRSQNTSSGVSSEQFSKLNSKLDKIIKILETLEIVDEEGEGSEENLEDDEDSEEEEEVSEEDEKLENDDKKSEDDEEDSDENSN